MAELLINFASGVLTADPGTSGTTLNSGQFAYLPAVTTPQTMRLSIDPDGLTGTPEICIVTAHTASATSLTVTRGQETAYGAGAARAHAVDTVWRHALTHASLEEIMVPAGTVTATVGATADPGYVLIDGSTVTGAQTLYPATWARLPASWKSGVNMVLPDWRGCTLFSDDTAAVFTLGASGGANTHAITQAELPAVGITIDPPSTNLTVNPPSTAVTGSTGTESATHTHSEGSNFGSHMVDVGSTVAVSPAVTSQTSGLPSVSHTHPAGTLAVDIAPFTATVDIVSFTSGNLGSGTAMNMLPAHGVVNYQLKVH